MAPTLALVTPTTPSSVNHTLPSGPAVTPVGRALEARPPYSTTVPVGVTRAIWSAVDSANQMLPSGPGAMPAGPLAAEGSAYSVTAPAGVTLPTWLLADSVSHMLPSGPPAIADGWLPAVGRTNSVIVGPDACAVHPLTNGAQAQINAAAAAARAIGRIRICPTLVPRCDSSGDDRVATM